MNALPAVPQVRCIVPGERCARRHPESVVEPEQAQRLLLVVYGGTVVQAATSHGQVPTAELPGTEVSMLCYMDPGTGAWRWALEVWAGGKKTLHDYPGPPQPHYDAIVRNGRLQAVGANRPPTPPR